MSSFCQKNVVIPKKTKERFFLFSETKNVSIMWFCLQHNKPLTTINFFKNTFTDGTIGQQCHMKTLPGAL